MPQQPIPEDDGRREEPLAPREPASAPEAGPTFAEPEPRVQDLSQEIVKTLAKSAGERVTCRRISGNHYRCNWWTAQSPKKYDNPHMAALTVTTHRVSRSELLHVTRTAKGLTIRPAVVRNLNAPQA
jgi:hypothetical protein